MAPSQDKWMRRFVITETNRHKKGFTIYKVTSLVFLKNSPEIASRISVWKRYNDFKKLHKSLYVYYKNSSIEEPFPPYAKPKFFGRFEQEVVNERRECAIKLLEYIANYTALYTNEIFVRFFETTLANDSIDCSQSISSDTSEDDHNINHDDINCLHFQNVASKTMDNFPSTSKLLFNTKSIYNNTTKQTIHNTSQFMSSECQKSNSGGVKLNREVGSAKFDDGAEKRRAISTTNGSELIESFDDSDDRYVLVAAAHMSAGYRHEALDENEEAYMQYKLGIAHLRHGVQFDRNSSRQLKILEKIRKYSNRADRLYKKCLNCNVTLLCKPVTELENYKVLKVMGSLMLVKDTRQNIERVIKTVEKRVGDKEDISHYILKQRVPFMVHLHAFIQTETTVFLVLEYANGGKLWDFLKSHYGISENKSGKLKKHCERSASCNDVFQINQLQFNKDASPISITKNHLNPKESLRMLKNEFGANSIYNKDVPINKLLEKSQKLLKSVDATLKKSNSVASKLNEFVSLLYEPKETSLFSKTNDMENTADDESGELSLRSYSSDNLSFETINISVVSDMQCSCNISPVTRSKEGTDKHHHVEMTTEFYNNSQKRTSEDSEVEIEQEHWKVPEVDIKQWAGQFILALEVLHQQNVVVSNLRPDDLLINCSNDIALSYVVPRQRDELTGFQMPYAAPELCMYMLPISTNPAVDIWSFGVILYELLTGIPFQIRHQGLFYSCSTINIPHELSDNAKSLLLNVLKFKPSERLTILEVKKHPFFEGIDWLTLSRS